MNILITGAAGFIGYHLSAYILEHSDSSARLTLVDNLQRGAMDADMEALLKDERVTFLRLDLTDLSAYEQLKNGYDQVYHLAAVNGTDLFYKIPQEVLRVNILSLIYMLEWFRNENPQGMFCFTSSNEAYAGGLIAFNQLPIPTPENVPLVIADTYNPRWSYAGTKLIGELCVINYARAYDLKACLVRPHNFYGPRAGYSHVIPQFASRIAKREDPFAVYGLEDTRTFCYIEDAVRAMDMIMSCEKVQNARPIETIHIGNTDEIATGDLLETMFDVAGWRPHDIQKHEAAEGSVSRRLADITKIRSMVGWEPEISLKEGLRRTYEWYVAHVHD